MHLYTSPEVPQPCRLCNVLIHHVMSCISMKRRTPTRSAGHKEMLPLFLIPVVGVYLWCSTLTGAFAKHLRVFYSAYEPHINYVLKCFVQAIRHSSLLSYRGLTSKYSFLQERAVNISLYTTFVRLLVRRMTQFD